VARRWTTTCCSGPTTALDVVCDITGAETVDIVGLCLGGAMTAITAAYLTQAGDTRSAR
jgi:polyhydroxyalkanoate synthase